MNERINMIECNYRHRKDKTIDEIVALIHPDYVSVNNCPGGCTGSAKVKSFQVEYDTDGVHMYVDVR